MAIHVMYLLSNPPIDAHDVCLFGLPLDPSIDLPDSVIEACLDLVDAPAYLVQAAVVYTRLQVRHLIDAFPHIFSCLNRGLLQRLLHALHISLVLLNFIHLGFEVAYDFRGCQVCAICHSGGEPVVQIK